MTNNIQWPVKKRELCHSHFDSTIWNNFPFRDDDIFIATYAKSGTTWIQQIVSQLLFNGQTGLNVEQMSPWMDFRLPPEEVKMALIAEQKHRRFLKTHLPLDALVYSPKAKYLYIARDGRDVLWISTITPIMWMHFMTCLTKPAAQELNHLRLLKTTLSRFIENG